MRLPRPDRIPNLSNLRTVPEIDTGAGFRADWRKQAPSSDPKEPYGSESGGTGEDHAWSNCTMTSTALAFAYQVRDQSGPWGGNMRHNQDDMSGGTDLNDAKTAWKRYGNQTLTIKTGAGWGAVKTAHNEGRAIIIQGEGNVPGSESFDGGHACCIAPETHSDGRWLFGDPLASGWQWVKVADIEKWAKALSSNIYFAVTKLPPPPEPTEPPPTEPEPEPEPPPYVPPPEYVRLQAVDFKAIEASAVAVADSITLSDIALWMMYPDVVPPPPLIRDAQKMLANPNGGIWDRGKWNQTNWYILPDVGRWGVSAWGDESVWA